MAQRVDFPFVTKEGKHFAPIVRAEDEFVLINNAISKTGRTKLVGGIKGVYAQVRILLPEQVAGEKSELFALNSEAVNSSF